jgi:hypothetical protein
MFNAHSMASGFHHATLCWLNAATPRLTFLFVVRQMLLFVSAIALIAAATATVPGVSILCLAAGVGCIILEAFI